MVDTDHSHTCLLCGQEMRPWINVPGDWRKPERDITFQGFWCDADKFGKILPTPSESVIADHYDIKTYYTRVSQLGEDEKSWSFLDRALSRAAYSVDHGIKYSPDLIAERLGKRNARVLEIGCGHGDNLSKLSSYGYDCVGIEPDPNSKARQSDFKIPVYDGTGESPPEALRGEKFDCVMMSHVLEHCTDPVATLDNVKNYLKDDGFAYIEVPNIACADFKFTKLAWPHLDVPRHLNHFCEKSLLKCFDAAQLPTPDIHYAHYNRQMLPDWMESNKPIIKYYRDKGAIGWSPKDLGALYNWGLFAVTALAPRSFKYDSLIAIANKN